MANVIRENVGVLTDHITVTLVKDDYYPAFEKALKNYSKQANIPGFRKGMVPMGVVKKMYGSSIYSDEVLRCVEKEINAYLDAERPDIFGQPLPLDANADAIRQMDMNHPVDYPFTFEIGLKPEVVPANLQNALITRKNVGITPSMLQEEIDRLQNRYGTKTEPTTVANEAHVLNLIFSEIDAEGNLLESGIVKENSLLVSYFSETIRPRWIGLGIGDFLAATINNAFDTKEKEWIVDDLGLKSSEHPGEKHFRMTIHKIAFVEKQELTPEFFNQLFPGKAIATEDEFKASLTEDLQNHWKNQTRTQVQDEIYHFLMDTTSIVLPEAFLRRWLKEGANQQKTAEEVEKEFPKFVNSLKWSLISDQIINQLQLEVTPDELRNYAKTQMMQYMGVAAVDESNAWLDSYIDNMMKDRKYIEENHHRLLTEKLFSWVETQVQYQDTEVTVEAFLAQQHHHDH